MPVEPALGRQKQEDHLFQASLGYIYLFKSEEDKQFPEFLNRIM
jgi:hypothetical protein